MEYIGYAIVGILVIVGILAIIGQFIQEKPIKTTSLALFTPKEDCTTVIPIPIHASTCDHKWDIITDHVLEAEHEKRMVTILSCRHCGLIDKTVQITSPQPILPPKPPEPCKHEWNVQVDQTLDLSHEQKIVVVMTCHLCGQIDKTIETTSKTAISKAECRHKWETEKKVELLSAYEQMLKSVTVNGMNKNKLDLDLNKSPAWMFRKTYVSIRVCCGCGEIDKTITSNFDLEELPEEMKEELSEETKEVSTKRKK